MPATEVGNSERKHSTEHRVSPPDQYQFSKLLGGRKHFLVTSNWDMDGTEPKREVMG